MNNERDLREIKTSIGGFVRTLERLKGLLGKETEVYASIRMNPTVANAFHKAQICTEQNIDAFSGPRHGVGRPAWKERLNQPFFTDDRINTRAGIGAPDGAVGLSDGAPFDPRGEVAEVLGIAPATLDNWRSQRKGPAYVKVGGAVRYRLKCLNDFINANTVFPTESVTAEQQTPRKLTIRPVPSKARRFGRHRTQRDRQLENLLRKSTG